MSDLDALRVILPPITPNERRRTAATMTAWKDSGDPCLWCFLGADLVRDEEGNVYHSAPGWIGGCHRKYAEEVTV